MPNCMLKSCNCTWRKRNEVVMLHNFPSERNRIQKWLEQLNVCGDELEYLLEKISASKKGAYRICSRHFKETDYEHRGQRKVLKYLAYPTLNLDHMMENQKTAGSTLIRLDADHVYCKRQKNEDAQPGGEGPPVPSETYSDGTFNVPDLGVPDLGPPDDVAAVQLLETQIAEVDVTETPYMDCILENPDEKASFFAEHGSEIPISNSPKRQLKHCTICPHGLMVSNRSKMKKFSRGTQFKEKIVRDKKIQVTPKPSKVSVGLQCSLADLPPLSLLQRTDIGNIASSMEGILHSSSGERQSGAVLQTIKKENVDILSPGMDPDDYFSGVSFAPKRKRSKKDTSYRPSYAENCNVQQQKPECNIDQDEDQSLVYLPPDELQSNMAKTKKFFVFEQCLDQLLMSSRCVHDTLCNGRITAIRKYTVGSALVVYAECSSYHKFKLWSSQPFIGRMPAGNLLLSSAILCSGSNFWTTQNFFSLLETPFISPTTHSNNQRKYLFPTIERCWSAQRSKIVERIGHKSVALLCDGQWDSPGSSAKYCTYTLTDAESQQIVDFQVEELQPGRSSAALENVALEECLNRIRLDRVNVKMIATDRRASLRRAVKKKKHPRIKHEFDAWRLAKLVAARLRAASKKMNCRKLSGWVPAARKHLWWAFRTSQNNPNLLKEKWISIVYHSANEHEWTGNTAYHRCSHPPMTSDEAKRYEWLMPGSAAHHRLKSIVQDSRLLEDLGRLSGFYHTGEIEVFRSAVLKHHPKGQRLFMDSVVARTQLAALDHNCDICRLQEEIGGRKDGGDHQGFSGRRCDFSKERRASKIYKPDSQVFMKEIVSEALEFSAGLRNFV